MAHALDYAKLVIAAGSRCRVAVGQTDVDKIKNCQPGSVLARWIAENLTVDTVLSSEELVLSEGIAKNKILQRDIAHVQPENLIPVTEDELLYAITEMEQSTEMLHRQTQVLEAQRDLAQRKLHEEARLRQQTQTLADDITRRAETNIQSLKGAVVEGAEELESLFRTTRAEVDSILKRIPSVVSELLNSNDRSFASLAKLDLTEIGSNESKGISLEDVERLTQILSHAVTEEIQIKLDRIYLESFQRPLQHSKTDQNETDETVLALEQDLNSLYSEILDVAEMYVRQRYTEPLIRAIQMADTKQTALASSYSRRIVGEISEMTVVLDELRDRLQVLQSYRWVLQKMQDDHAATNVKEKSNLPIATKSKTQQQTQVGPAMEGLLRHFGLPVTTPGDICKSISEKVTRLRKGGEGSIEVISHDVKQTAGTRRTIVGSLAESIDQGSVDDLAELRDLEGEITNLREQVEAVSVTDTSRDTRKQKAFTERWA